MSRRGWAGEDERAHLGRGTARRGREGKGERGWNGASAGVCVNVRLEVIKGTEEEEM